MTSDTIMDLLAAKHSQDVFVAECKAGPSQFGGPRMDAWAMRKSWAHPCYTCYEVKVSRSDFLSDVKWVTYLDLCNEFYWVCPSGLINVSEIANGCGLLHVSKTGTKLFTKRKAQHRTIGPPVGVLEYILMWRATVGPIANHLTDRQYWAQWLEHRADDREFGYRVSKALRDTIETRINQVAAENKRLNAGMEQVAQCKDELARMGVKLGAGHYDLRGHVREVLAQHDGKSLASHCEQLASGLQHMARELNDVAGFTPDTLPRVAAPATP
jgi:hypothetical protein